MSMIETNEAYMNRLRNEESVIRRDRTGLLRKDGQKDRSPRKNARTALPI